MTDGLRLDQLFAEARASLATGLSETPDLDARLLIEWVTGTTRLEMISRPDTMIEPELVEKTRAVLVRRIAGEPVHRIIGSRAFYGLNFRLSATTLEPRPDTESLIELVLPFLRQRITAQGFADLIDMGTGTGAIAVTLLKQFSKLRAVGVDVAAGALATARLNAQDAGVSARFAALHSDWFANVTGRFDLIISNPPYIPHHEIAALSRDVREHDPLAALDGGEDGLDFYRALAQQAAMHLYRWGMVAIEIGAGQKQDVSIIFARCGFRLVETVTDLGGFERALLFTQKTDDEA